MLGNMPHLRAVELTPERADQAYPLIAMTYPGTTVDAWQSFFGTVNFPCGASEPCTCGAHPNNHGILAVEDSNGYIYGVLRFSVVMQPDRQRVLAIDTVAVIDLLDRDTTMQTLLESARALADARGCCSMMALRPV